MELLKQKSVETPGVETGNLRVLRDDELQEVEGGSLFGCLVVGMALGYLAGQFVKGVNDFIREKF